MKLTTRSRYGTRMMLDIAMHCQEGPVRIQDIAARQGVSAKYLEKLIRKLKDGGFIKSKRGPRGGHCLAVAPTEISIGAVVQAAAAFITLVIDHRRLREQIEQGAAGDAGQTAGHALYQHLCIDIKLQHGIDGFAQFIQDIIE